MLKFGSFWVHEIIFHGLLIIYNTLFAVFVYMVFEKLPFKIAGE